MTKNRIYYFQNGETENEGVLFDGKFVNCQKVCFSHQISETEKKFPY